MKKWAFLAVAMVLGLSTIGCTEEKKPVTPAPTPSSTTTTTPATDTDTDAP